MKSRESFPTWGKKETCAIPQGSVKELPSMITRKQHHCLAFSSENHKDREEGKARGAVDAFPVLVFVSETNMIDKPAKRQNEKEPILPCM